MGGMVSKPSVAYDLSRQVSHFAISCMSAYTNKEMAGAFHSPSRHCETSQRLVVSSTQDHTCAMAEDDSWQVTGHRAAFMLRAAHNS